VKGFGVTLDERVMSVERKIEFMNAHYEAPPNSVDTGENMALILVLAAILAGAIYLAWRISRRRLRGQG
jgi:hypothetical protein